MSVLSVTPTTPGDHPVCVDIGVKYGLEQYAEYFALTAKKDTVKWTHKKETDKMGILLTFVCLHFK